MGYRETYAYDPAGNLLALQHSVDDAGWTRTFGMGGLTPQAWAAAWPEHVNAPWDDQPPNNRLTHVGDNHPDVRQTHVFDASGNLVRETLSRHFAWDHADRLKAFSIDATGRNPSVPSFCRSTTQRGSAQRNSLTG